VPILRHERVHTVVEDPGALALDAHALLESFRKRLVDRGGVLATHSRIEAIERSTGGWRLRCAGQACEADVIVNAAGAWGDEVATLAGVSPLGVSPRRRTALLVDPGVPFRDWPLVHRAEGGLYFKPEAGSLMVSLGDEMPSPPCDARPDELDVATAVERFGEMTTVNVRRLQQTWAGLRTFLPDRLPAVGYDRREDRFFWLVGQGGFGMQTSPALAELAARLLNGEDDPLADALTPTRFTT
jgi:D-arginine dehydrogenase